MSKSVLRAVGAGMAGLLSLAALPAIAADLNATTSCLRGSVAANDYAELTQQLNETNWDAKGGVTLVSTVGNLRLRVFDPLGNSVCEETANNATQCTFKVNLSAIPEFTIIADNSGVGATNGYTICAY